MTTILIIDDETGIRAMLKTFLERAGFKAIAAADGQEGIDIFRERHDEIGCSIVDMSMPGIDGLATCHELRKIDPQCILLICSGYPDDRIDSFRRTSGTTEFVSKPFNFQALLESIKSVIPTAG